MEGKDVKQVLALKYIIRRIVAILIVAAVVAIPAIYGANGAAREEAREKARAAQESVQSGTAADSDDKAASGATADGDSGDDAGGADPDIAAVIPEVSVGTVLMYAGDKMPDGFLRCDGSQVPRDAYKELYAVIGDKYGAGDGESTFNLPNMRTLLPVSGSGTGDVNVGEKKDAQSVAPADTTTVARAVPAETAFKKLSDPSGPPPDTAEADKKESGSGSASGAEGSGSASGGADSGSADSGNGSGAGTETDSAEDTRTAVMYFIIKY
jgi:microcystin-dependent protein